MQQHLSWEASIHLYKDKTILKQLGIAIGIPFGVLLLFLLWVASTSTSSSRFYGIFMIVLLFVITGVFIYVVFENKIHVRYILNQKSITMKMSDKQAIKNKWVNHSTFILGLLRLNPTAMGVGLLANSNQQQTIKLVSIQQLKTDDAHHRLVIKDAYYEFIVQCTAQNYQDVKNFLQQHSLF